MMDESGSAEGGTVDDSFGIPNPLVLIGKVGTALTKPILKIGEIFTIPENETREEEEQDVIEDSRMSIEGTLYHRKGRSHKWKRRLVVLKFESGGTFECYNVDNPSNLLKDMYSQLHRSSNVGKSLRETGDSQSLTLLLKQDMPWVVRDIENDPSQFVVEIPTHDERFMRDLLVADSDHTDLFDALQQQNSYDQDDEMESSSVRREAFEAVEEIKSEDYSESSAIMSLANRAKLERDFKAAQHSKRPLRLYFKCPRKGNEKALWLRGFAKLDRLSDSWKKRNFLGKLAHITLTTSRIRRDDRADFARDARQLEMDVLSPQIRSTSDMSHTTKLVGANRREFRVYPNYCYPHVWMTQQELQEECDLLSSTFHDLRLETRKDQEIGNLRVEVLQGIGLSRMDRSSETDAVCYLVCGQYAFATDVIPDNRNPMWLRKSRRACIFPVFHGYARLFVGVFDHDGYTYKDDFVGRVVIDLARLRPGSRYDVTLPLRLSAHVYSKRQRGAIRIRFQVDWKSERAALMSYLPATLKIPKRAGTKPDTRTTIMCTDPTSFRNIVLTVHGGHPPGKFSYNQFRATLKEINFTRKMTMMTIRETIRDTIVWKNPAMSMFVFCGWMHCIYEDSFGLVPAYFTSFLVLHLFRNYAAHAIDGPSSRGFLPPTWEEMLLALLFSKETTQTIEPLNMTPRNGPPSVRNSLELPPEETALHESHDIITHKPKGKWLFRTLGFLEPPEVLDQMDPDERHLEFPFSEGRGYPKLRVRNQVATKGKTPQNDSSQNGKIKNKSRNNRDRDEDAFVLEAEEFDDTFDEGLGRSGALGGELDDHTLTPRTEVDAEDLGSLRGAEDMPSGETNLTMIPDQDIDLKIDSGGKKMTDDLVEIQENMHRFTWNLFNDKTHVIKHPDPAYFGQDRKGSKKRDVNKELEKLLNVGNYSNKNPVYSRAGQYLQPLVGGSLSFLSVFRALYNIYTWRDPFFTFWVSLVGLALVAVLFIFPWRLFLFILGILLVGPQVSLCCCHLFLAKHINVSKLNLLLYQNWIRRLVRERMPKKEELGENRIPELSSRIPNDQPLFKAHPPPDTRYEEIDVDKVNPREVHHVVVPYSPLMYQNRFYDWPPEPEYSVVKHKPSGKSLLRPTLQGRTSSGRSITELDASEAFARYINSSFQPTGVPAVVKGHRRSYTADWDIMSEAQFVQRRRQLTLDFESEAQPQFVCTNRRRSRTADFSDKKEAPLNAPYMVVRHLSFEKGPQSKTNKSE
jgi:hypothetical protein